MKNTQHIVDALVAKYQAQRLEGIANLQIYFDGADLDNQGIIGVITRQNFTA